MAKAKRKPVSTGKPAAALSTLLLLGKRTDEDRKILISLLEHDSAMPAARRERFAAMLLLDFEKMSEHLQDRFATVMQSGSADERRRIACLVSRK